MRSTATKALLGTTGLTAARVLMGPAAQPKVENTDDPVALVEQINKAFNDLKESNEKLLKEHDALTENKVETINAVITDLQGKLDDALAKQAKDMAALKLRGGSNENKDMETHARAFAIQAAAGQNEGRSTIRNLMAAEPNVDAFERYTAAFNLLVAHGGNVNAIGNADIRNDLSLGVDSDGGYLVPPNQASEFVKRIFDTSPMRQVANVIPTLGNTYEYPLDTEEGISGGWVSEKQTREKTGTPKVGMGEIKAHEQYAYPQITQNALEDRMLIDQANWIDMKSSDKMVRTENEGFVLGNGVGKPRGFTDYATTVQQDKDRAWGKLQHVLSGANGGFDALAGGGDDADPIIDIVYALKQQYRQGAIWAMNRFTEASFRKLKDADGNYRWTPAQAPGQPALLENYPVWNFEDMADLATGSISAAFGNFKEGYTILDRMGTSLLVDPYTNKPFVGFYFRRRVGGDVTNFDAIKLMKFSA